MLRLPEPELRPWRPIHRETVGSYRVFDVQRVELEDGEGRPRGDAFVFGVPDWCNVVALTPDDQVVLVWQYRFGSGAMSLEIPGGVVDPGEAPDRAARRELREETGYEADAWQPLLVVQPNPALQNNRCHTYLARGARPRLVERQPGLATAATDFDAQEELETVLVPAHRIPDLLDGGQVTHSLVQGALEAFCRKVLR